MTENNDNRNTITYDDDWKSVSYSEYPKVSEELDSDEEDVNSLSAENSDEKKNSPKQLVITIQLVCCILIALAAFLLNLFGGEVYAATREWYYSNLFTRLPWSNMCDTKYIFRISMLHYGCDYS